MSAPPPWLASLPDGEREARLKYLREGAYVVRYSFGGGRIVVDIKPHPLYEPEFWCFLSITEAVMALDEWRSSGALEPKGWTRAAAPERRRCDTHFDQTYSDGGLCPTCRG